MRLFQVLVIAVVLGWPATGLWAEPQGPRVVELQAEYDFGTVLEGTVVKHEFVIKNVGSGSLQLERIVPICGCTAVSTTGEKIPAGAQGAVAVEFNTLGFPGPQEKLIRVYTNEIGRRFLVFKLVGQVVPEIIVEPPVLNFGSVPRGESAQIDLSLRVPEQSTAAIDSWKLYAPGLQLEELESGRRSRLLRLKLSPDAAYGDFRGRLVLLLQEAKRPTVNVPIVGRVESSLQLRPPLVTFGVVAGTEPLTKRARLISTSAKGAEIKDAAVKHSALTALILPDRDGRKTVLELVLDPQELIGPLRTVVNLTLSSGADQAEEKLTLPVRAFLPPPIKD